MKIRIEKEVSIASAFTHLIAAWDWRALPWYRSVEYTIAGDRAINPGKEPPGPSSLLAVVTMDDPDNDDGTITVRIDGRWIEEALTACVERGGSVARDAMRIIDEDPAADQNTADVVFQVGAYGRVVFG